MLQIIILEVEGSVVCVIVCVEVKVFFFNSWSPLSVFQQSHVNRFDSCNSSTSSLLSCVRAGITVFP